MTYKGKGGKQYSLAQAPFAQGGEGKVYTVTGNSKIVAKLYKNGLNTVEKERKLITMVDNPPDKDVMTQISWPLDVLYDSSNRFVGFIMPKLDINEDLNVIYEYGSTAKYPNIPWTNKIIIAKNLCAVLDAVHSAGHVVGDLNPKNISVDPSTGHIVFVDTDSYHIEDNGTVYRCNVGMPEYLPAEIQRKMKNGLSAAPLPTFSKDTDNFALAVHIFQLLMNGTHPFACKILPSTASIVFPQPTDNILNGVFPFMQPAPGTTIPLYAPSIDVLPQYMQDLFNRAFITGHIDPKSRPNAEEWYNALTQMGNELVHCKNVSHHEYHNGSKNCPWCEVDKRFSGGVSGGRKKPLSQGTFAGGITPPPPKSWSTSTYGNSTNLYAGGRRTKKNSSKKKVAIISLVTVFCVVLLVAAGFGFNTYNENKKVENVYNLIYDLPDADVIDYDAYGDEILSVISEYNNLPEDLKNKVENKDKLLSLLSSYNLFKVDKVRNKANEINVDTVKTSSVLSEFVTLYSELTADQKELLSSDEISMFDNLEKVNQVITSLNYIDENIGERYQDLSNTKSIYNSIDTDYLALVYNSDLLDSLELKYELREYIEIDSANELMSLANQNGKYILVRDIDLAGQNWTPIENFSGILYGNGYSIKNITINEVNKENLGLFAVLQGTVQNLTIENAKITSSGDIGKAGIVAGTNQGTISNVVVTGSVVANYYDNVGGIVGYNNNGIISNCNNQALVIGNNNVGGIAGYLCVNGHNKADQNVNNGEISGNSNIGGVFGYLTSQTVKTDDNFSYAIAQNKNNNSVKGKNNVGGVIGNITPAGKYASNWYGLGYFTISVFSNNGEVTATGDCVGGIIGYAERLSEITVSENKANITGSNFVGGYVGKSAGTTIKIAENNNVITGKGYVGGIAGYAGRIENATNNGDIVSTSIIVEDGASRSYVGGIAGFCTAIINSKNTTDIIVNNAGSFVGGLVGYLRVSGSEQLNGNENLGDVKGKDSVGGIVGYATMSTVKTDDNFNYAFAENTNNGNVTGTSEVGGIVGNLVGAGKYASNWYGLGYFNVSLCKNNAEVIGTGNNVGGIIGNATRLATMTVCENNADITGNDCVGGYVGNGSGANIKLATNNNAITGKGYVGGIAGIAGKVENSTNNGVINSTGVVVENSTSMSYVGGIAGYCTGLINCTNNSDINVSTGGQFVGGLAGYILFSSDNQINDNQNYGKITGSKYTGGIAGYIQSATVKTDDDFTRSIGANKNYASVNGTDYVAGIFGYVYGAGKYASNWYGVCYIILTYCENQAEISGSSYVGGIVGGYTRLKTDANLMDTNSTLHGEKLGH